MILPKDKEYSFICGSCNLSFTYRGLLTPKDDDWGKVKKCPICNKTAKIAPKDKCWVYNRQDIECIENCVYDSLGRTTCDKWQRRKLLNGE